MNQPTPSNSLGLAGFICSLVGLACTVGLLSPVGLILSLIALKDEPKGFAIAGVVLGALGSCGALVMVFIFPVAIIGMLLAFGIGVAFLAPLLGDAFVAQVEMARLDQKIGQYETANAGALPADLGSLPSVTQDLLTDPWGNPYQFDLTTPTADRPFRLFSKGPDGIAGTADDIVFLEGDIQFNLR